MAQEKTTKAPADTRPRWTEQYNCHRLSLAAGLDVAINWDSTSQKGVDHPDGHWKLYAIGREIGRAKDFAEGQRRVLEMAVKHLRYAAGRAEEALIILKAGEDSNHAKG